LDANSLQSGSVLNAIQQRYLGDQFKSGGGEGGLFHEDITLESGVTMTFAELP
jgi:hypothetical protein